ncbi:MAG: MaoC family dehydratase [Actinomycetota bacterium]
MVTLNGPEEVKAAQGRDLGASDWYEVTQEAIDTFADITGDHQFIHVDVEKAKQTPFGGTIAHGFFTLSLMPMFNYSLLAVEGFAFAVNYGLNRVRFPAPMMVGKRVRMSIKLVKVEEVAGGLQLTTENTFECEGSEKPVCVAEQISRVYVGA